MLAFVPTVSFLWALNRLGLHPSRWLIKAMTGVMNAARYKQRVFARYTPLKGDVIVATYAKSGTNWAMQIALQTAWYGEAEYDFIHDLVPWPDGPIPGIKARIDDQTLGRKAPTGIRVIKTHLEQPYVLYDPAVKYIVVLRDPKDVLVSSYYFVQSIYEDLVGFHYSLEEWLDLFISSRFLFGSWAVHTASWWALRKRKNVLGLMFKDMKQDLEGEVQRIARLMDVSLARSQLEKVVEKSSFQHMKANDAKFVPQFNVFGKTRRLGTMVRDGKVGKSRETLTPEQRFRIDQFCRAELEQLGSDFPYAALFMD